MLQHRCQRDSVPFRFAPALFAVCALVAGLGPSPAAAAVVRTSGQAAPAAGTSLLAGDDSFTTDSPLPTLTELPRVLTGPGPRSVSVRSGSLGPLARFEIPSGAGRTIYLTFDDGPDQTWTPRILALLRRYHVSATFFVIGWEATDHPGLLRAEVASGSQVENHTQYHRALTGVAPDRLLVTEILPVNRAIESITGTTPRCVRPPYGVFNASVRAGIGSIGMRLAMWNVDPMDWSRPGTPAIRDAVLAGVRPGAVVIMHDGGGDRSETVAALSELLPRLLAAHWHFGTLCH